MDAPESTAAQPWVGGLREIVKAPADHWRPRMADLIGNSPDPRQLQEMRAFLKDHLPGSGDQHRERMSAMIALLSTSLSELGRDAAVIGDLVGNIADLQGEIERLSKALWSAKGALAAMLGPGKAQIVASYSVRIGQPQQSLRILSRDKVPKAFWSSQPDRQLILRHFRSTGEVPGGVEIRQTRTPVTVKPITAS